MFDVNLALRLASAGAVSANEQTTSTQGVNFGGADRLPLTYVVRVPSVSGTTPTMDLEIRECATQTGTYTKRLVFPQITAVGVYYFKAMFKQPWRSRYITVGGTTPNFGATTINVAFGSDYDNV
jgi:hypothetical protein